MRNVCRHFTALAVVSTIASLSAHAQVHPICADLPPFLLSAQNPQPFSNLYMGTSKVPKPATMGRGECHVEDGSGGKELTCSVTSYSPPVLDNETARAARETYHQKYRNNLVRHLQSCPQLENWETADEVSWAGKDSFYAYGYQQLLTDPETGTKFGARTVIDKSKAPDDAWHLNYTSQLVFISP